MSCLPNYNRPYKADLRKILVGLVTLGVILSAIGIYKPFAQWAGAGATVPLLGFGHSLWPREL